MDKYKRMQKSWKINLKNSQKVGPKGKEIEHMKEKIRTIWEFQWDPTQSF